MIMEQWVFILNLYYTSQQITMVSKGACEYALSRIGKHYRDPSYCIEKRSGVIIVGESSRI